MSKLKIKVVFLLFVFVLASTFSFSQSKEEKELIKTGEKLFKKQDFTEAVKVYRQLISSDSENPEFNYKYGACLLHTSKKKGDALNYLKYAVENQSSVGEAHFFLARAYHVSYQFEEAIKYYTKFKSSLKSKEVKKYQIDLLISECQRAKEIIKDFKQIKVVSTKKIKNSQFFRAYKLGKMNRKILVKPDEFNSEEDGEFESNEPKLVVHGPDQLTLIFSAYKKDQVTGEYDKDLYMVTREEGEETWSSFQTLGSNVNTNFDEEYPYLHPNGKVLYFSSKGHGGLGGYDIYRSELNDGEWGVPVNVGFSINSPFDDILYVVDQNENAAYFSSNRQNSIDEITVYKIIPPQNNNGFVLVKGDVKIEGVKTKKSLISIFNSKTGEFVGQYKSDNKNGSFAFPLVEKESYDIEFTFLDSLKSTVSISTPAKSDKEVIYQEVVLNSERDAQIREDLAFKASEKERAEIINRLASLGKNQIKDIEFSPEPPTKVGLEVATASADINTSVDDSSNPTFSVIEDQTKSNVIDEPADLIGKAELELEKIKSENAATEKEIEASYQIANEKNKNALALKAELEDLLSGNESEITSEEQELQGKKQVKLNKEILDASNALAYASALEKELDVKKNEEKLSSSYVEALISADESESTAESIEKLEQYQKELSQLKEIQEQAGDDYYEEDLKRKQGQLLDDKKSIASKVNELKSEFKIIEQEKAMLQGQIEDTKRKSVKEELALQIEELNTDQSKKQVKLIEAEKELAQINANVDQISSKIELISLVKNSANDNLGPGLSQNEKEALIENVSANVASIADMPQPELIAMSDKSSSSEVAGSGINDENYSDYKVSSIKDSDVSSSTAKMNLSEGANQNLSFSKTNVEPTHSQELIASDLKGADDDQIDDLGMKVFNFPAPIDNKTESKKISRNEKLANDKIKEALSIQKLVEEKKVQYAAVSNDKERQSLEDEIAMLERQVQGLKSDAALKRQFANAEKFRKKKEELDYEVFVNPEINSDAVKEKRQEVESLWEQAASIKNAKNTATSFEEKDKMLTSQMLAESKAIQAQSDLEELIKNNKSATGETNIVANSDNIKQDTDDTGIVKDMTTSSMTNESTFTNEEELAYGSDVNKRDDVIENNEVSEYTGEVANEISSTEKKSVNEQSKLVNDNNRVNNQVSSETVEQIGASSVSPFNENDANENKVGGSTVEEQIEYENQKREEYKNKAESLVNKAMQATDAYEQQKLFEEAALYELAGDEQKMVEYNFEAQEEFTAYEENVTLIEDAKRKMNKNSLAAEAFRLEEKSATLYIKAQEKLKEANAEVDPLLKINKTNEAKEIIAYSRLKQKEALKKYNSSARKPENSTYADRNFELKPESIVQGELLTDNLLSDNSTGNDNKVISVNIDANKSNDSTNSEEEVDELLVDNAIDNDMMNDPIAVDTEEKISAISMEDLGNSSEVGNVDVTANSGQITNSKSDYLLAYEKLIKEAQEIEAEEDERRQKIEELKFLAQKNKDKSEKALIDAQSLSDSEQKEKKIQEANVFREQAEAREVAYKDEEYFMANNLAEAKSKRSEAQMILDVLSDNEKGEALAINESSIVYPSYDFDDTKGTYSPSTMTVKEGFKVIPTTRYTSRTVIPIDVELPSGLLYKVQVGAFRNKINPAIFNGITPLSGENAGAGITRYTAGLFKSFLAANMAKGRIRNLGYSDAFVVAFYNGKRISMEDAEKRRDNADSDEKKEYLASREKEVKALKKIGITEAEASSKGGERVNPIDLFEESKSQTVQNNDVKEEAAQSENINNVNGVYYTVQIGVYSSFRTSAQLFNITPLQSYNTSKGYIRYSTGVYRSIEEANRRRDEVKAIGVSDAFVVAYQDGKRINVNQASQSDGGLNLRQSINTNEGVVFKVQIAAYKSQVNIANNPTFNQLSSFGIDYTTTSSGLLLYTAGSFTTKGEADELREQIINLGISDAFVVAFKNGQKISVRQAVSSVE